MVPQPVFVLLCAPAPQIGSRTKGESRRSLRGRSQGLPVPHLSSSPSSSSSSPTRNSTNAESPAPRFGHLLPDTGWTYCGRSRSRDRELPEDARRTPDPAQHIYLWGEIRAYIGRLFFGDRHTLTSCGPVSLVSVATHCGSDFSQWSTRFQLRSLPCSH